MWPSWSQPVPNLKPPSILQKELIESIRRARTVADAVKADKQRRQDAEPFEPRPQWSNVVTRPLEFPKK